MTASDVAVFRIVTQQRLLDAFAGEGARVYGGRWNPKGIRVVYTAGSRALAMLEMLVQDQPLRANYALIPARIPASVRIERISLSKLPTEWSTSEEIEALRAIGADWLRRAKTAVLCVPSAVVPSEFNYLLNPTHADFGRIKLGRVETLRTDPRLILRLTQPTAPRRR